MQQEVNIIIVNWNGYDHTCELVSSLEKMTFKNYSITVVDNGSSGNDAERLNSEFGDRIQLIESGSNIGFAGGNNLAIKEALRKDFKYFLLINNDTTVEPDFLPILLNKIASADIGIAAPQINYYYEPKIIWSAGGKISRLRSSGFAITGINEDKFDRSDRLVEFASGCCMLVKKEVFEKAGIFDENFFLYLEDTDLCLRTTRAGYKICLTPSAKIYHKVKSATGKKSVTPYYYETRNRLYFAKKNFHKSYFVAVIYIFLTMFIKSTVWLISGEIERIKYVYNGFVDFFNFRMGYRADQMKWKI